MQRRWLALLLCEGCLFPSLGGLSSTDAGDSDVVTSNEGGPSDAGAEADAAARFCASHGTAIFCDDFDQADAISPAWTTVNLMGDASIGLVQDMPVSTPNAARSTVAATTNSGEASIGRHVPVASGQTLSFGAALRADVWPTGAYASVATIYTDQTHLVALVLGYNNKSPILVVDNADGGSSTFAVALPPSGWFRVTFALAVTGTSSTIDLLINGQSAIGGAKPGPPVPLSNVTCYVGLYATNFASQIVWSFDDVYAEVN